MGKFREKSTLIFADAKYDSLFEQITKSQYTSSADYKDFFVLAATIGFKNTLRIKRENKGREIRASYLTPSEEELFLSILFNDKEINGNIEKLDEFSENNEGKRIIEEYVNGGLELIATKAFEDNWDGYKLNDNYRHYHYDLARFILSEVKSVPF